MSKLGNLFNQSERGNVLINCNYLYKFKIIIAATKPTIPASPSP